MLISARVSVGTTAVRLERLGQCVGIESGACRDRVGILQWSAQARFVHAEGCHHDDVARAKSCSRR